MIVRIWHGWTTHHNASAYERLLLEEIFPHITRQRIEGYRGIELYRRNADKGVEFITLMRFDALDAVIGFAGAVYEHAVVPPEAQALLHDYDRRATHFEVRMQREM